jgi:hypothetical protein
MRYRYLLEWLQASGCRPIIVASHPRSGTHLLIDCLRLNFAECHSWKYPLERINRLYLSWASLCGEAPHLTDRASARTLARVARPLVKTHL